MDLLIVKIIRIQKFDEYGIPVESGLRRLKFRYGRRGTQLSDGGALGD